MVPTLRPEIVELTVAIMLGTGYDVLRFWFGGPRDSSALERWRYIGPASCDQLMRGTPARPDESMFRNVSFAYGVAWSSSMFWHVDLGYDGISTPSLRFPTDPIGIRELFKARDVPDGKRRRAALRNWVRAHVRKRRKADPQAEIDVRKHLRGATSFTWCGMRARVSPSIDALRENGEIR